MGEHLLHAFSMMVGALHSRHPIRDVRKVLIYKPDHLGDMLMATPALRAIRRHYPEAEIKIVAGEWSTVILENNPNVDEIVTYNSRMFVRPPYVPESLRDLRRKLGDWRPDLVIGLRDDWQTLAGSIFSRVRRIERGRVHVKEWFERKRKGRGRDHELGRLWKTLRPLGIVPRAFESLEYFMTEEEEKLASQFLIANGIDRPFAVIHAGASQKVREWPLERFAETAREIAARQGVQIVLLGSPTEVERTRQLAALIPDLNPIDISGQLDLRITAAALKQASLYVGADGGLMHLAATIGVPTVGLFGPGHILFAPIGRKTTTIFHEFPCSPCDQVTCIRPNDSCMQAITVEEVIMETDKLMAEQQKEPQASAIYSHQPRV
jgi:heptosyltransferase-3